MYKILVMGEIGVFILNISPVLEMAEFKFKKRKIWAELPEKIINFA